MPITKTINLSGISHEYNDNTKFILQIGRYRNKYLTRAVRTGEYQELLNDYNNLDVHSGYKKRLVMLEADKTITLLKQISERDK